MAVFEWSGPGFGPYEARARQTYHLDYWIIHWERWLLPYMTEKLLTGTFNINTHRQNFTENNLHIMQKGKFSDELPMDVM